MVRLAVLCLVLAAFPARAQKSAIVECTIGRHAVQVPDYQCDVLLDMYGRLARLSNPSSYGQACADELDRRLGDGRIVWDLCGSMVGDINILRMTRGR